MAERPAIIVLDVETTGKDRARDQVIELCIQLGIGADAEQRGWRFKPSIPIAPEATTVHGITDADVAACSSFGGSASVVASILAGADVIVGYNVAFDLDMLQAELARAGCTPLDLGTKQIVDVLRLWHHVEPRTLAAAHAKFVGSELSNAHAAGADVSGTARVLEAMLGVFGLADKPWQELAAISDPFPGRDAWIGPSNHVQWRDDGWPVFMFGKNKGCRIDQVDPGFLRWVIAKDFPPHVKEVCRAALQMSGERLKPWLAERYPRRAAPPEATHG
jgi:DNA polymerase III subunit epsilon